MATFEKGNRIRNKYNGLTYTIIDILSATYEIKSETPPYGKWLLPFEDEDEWEVINCNNNEKKKIKVMNKSNSPWKSVKDELPIIDDEHEEGEVPYLVIYCEDDYYEGNDDEEFSSMDIGYFYGKTWKNSRWEKIHVSHWMEIPPLPSK